MSRSKREWFGWVSAGIVVLLLLAAVAVFQVGSGYVFLAVLVLWCLLRATRIPGFLHARKHPELYTYDRKTNTLTRNESQESPR